MDVFHSLLTRQKKNIIIFPELIKTYLIVIIHKLTQLKIHIFILGFFFRIELPKKKIDEKTILYHQYLIQFLFDHFENIMNR